MEGCGSPARLVFIAMPPQSAAFARLVEIIARLRAPDGCPWDREQTHRTLRAHLLEESAETLEAIESGDDVALCEELGDLLMQPVMHAQLAAEAGRFSIEDVVEGICEKLVRRHPHVFGDSEANSAAEVLKNWDAIKKVEKAERGEKTTSILDEGPPELPALAQSLKISKKAAKAGFEWPNLAGVVEKLREEAGELENALQNEGKERAAEELGDLLFTIVNLARWNGINPELALRDTNRRFLERFRHMESVAAQKVRALETLSGEEWEELWQAAKKA